MTCLHYQPETADGGHCAIHAYGVGVMVGPKVCARCKHHSAVGGQQSTNNSLIPSNILSTQKQDKLNPSQSHLPRPGTVLAGIFETLGFKKEKGCGCAEMAAQMNLWGVSGCREHKDEILNFLEKKAREKGVTTFVRTKAWLVLEAALANTALLQAAAKLGEPKET